MIIYVLIVVLVILVFSLLLGIRELNRTNRQTRILNYEIEMRLALLEKCVAEVKCESLMNGKEKSC